jgi:hypothetical protein
LNNALNSFLFSTGCANSLSVTFSGGNSISGASGSLILKQIKISGLYSTGVAYYKVVSGYSGSNNGYGYKTAPTFTITTGGACYSLPDYSGVSLSQFSRATGYGALYAQAAGLTGSVVMTGSGVSGLTLTNIGFGYNTTNLRPTVSFTRISGDTSVGTATGTLQMKMSGTYDFDSYWKAYYNLGDGWNSISGYNGYYSGNVNIFGQGNLGVQLVCSGLDNTSPVSGLLTIVISGNGKALTGQRIVSQSRTFNMFSGALAADPYPSYDLVPLPDMSYAFGEDQYDYQYKSDAGSKTESLIYF